MVATRYEMAREVTKLVRNDLYMNLFTVRSEMTSNQLVNE